jgi:hypothetical protein
LAFGLWPAGLLACLLLSAVFWGGLLCCCAAGCRSAAAVGCRLSGYFFIFSLSSRADWTCCHGVGLGLRGIDIHWRSTRLLNEVKKLMDTVRVDVGSAEDGEKEAANLCPD